jgi:ATP-dependent exoDNAse (exonuclease V) beta subunit
VTEVLPDLRARQAPAGSVFALAVTDLEIARDTAAAQAVRRPRARQPVDDASLDPLTRGRLSHMVLAALHRLPNHARSEHFVDAELRLCGYDPEDPRLAQTRIDLAAFLQSPLGKSVAQLDPSARRHELPFLLRFDIAPHIATVSGQIDLVYWHDDAPVILDYKHAHAADTPANAYTTQLDAYAYAVAELCAYDGPIRTQLVFLKDPHTSKVKVRERTVTAAMRKEFREAALNTMSFLTQ